MTRCITLIVFRQKWTLSVINWRRWSFELSEQHLRRSTFRGKKEKPPKCRVWDKFPKQSTFIFGVSEFSCNTTYNNPRVVSTLNTSSIYCSAVSIEHRLVIDRPTDRQTDRQTDRWTDAHSICRASRASQTWIKVENLSCFVCHFIGLSLLVIVVVASSICIITLAGGLAYLHRWAVIDARINLPVSSLVRLLCAGRDSTHVRPVGYEHSCKHNTQLFLTRNFSSLSILLF